ncbi:MAG: hypothetical protein GXO22_08835 [Aquificae bacterium]|nr:hypothetical protein [Aquificota bacterium]
MASSVEIKTVRIRFLDTNKFSEVEVPRYIKRGDFIVVKTQKGEELVIVLGNSIPMEQNEDIEFVRKATQEDIQLFDYLEKEAEKALEICKTLVEKHGLKMNLIRAYIPLSKNKVMFYYIAEGRVDFRQLVKDLAKKLKNRIEMRQIGVRDGVKMAGAIGPCGNQTCCSVFLDKFESIGVEILEEENLPPTPAKFTGICGRLMCCLAFEKENYSIRQNLPEIGSTIEIDNKPLKVQSYDFIKEAVIFTNEEGHKIEITFDTLDQLNIIKSPCTECAGGSCNQFLEVT